jgi:Uma2 family endonuclease
MATAAAKLLTAEEFMRLPDPPDGSQQELVKGKVISMPPPKGIHGVCCLKIAGELNQYLKQHPIGTATCNDAGFIVARGPDTVRGPDLAFWHRDRLAQMPEDEYTNIPPDLAVEVVSPDDTHSKLNHKVLQYIKCGVRMIWVVDPQLRIVTVYRSLSKSQVLENGDTLSGEDVLPGFACAVSELFP